MSRYKKLFVVVIVLFIAGCWFGPTRHHEDNLKLAVALTKLSSAVDSEVVYGNMASPPTEQEILAAISERTPELLEPFGDYKLRVNVFSDMSSVLVCSPDGKTAILEDSGYTANIDKHVWKETPGAPCEHTVDLSKLAEQ